MRCLRPFGMVLLLVAPAAAQQGSLPPPTQPQRAQQAQQPQQPARRQAQPGRQQTQGGAQGAQQATFEQQLSYAIGLQVGSEMRQTGVAIDVRHLATGVQDALTGAQPRLSQEQIAQVMSRFQQQMKQKVEEQMAQQAPQAAQNKQRGEAFLAENAQKPDVTVTDSGLQYRVLKKGNGPSPSATSVVRCNYEGRLIDGKVFDATEPGKPAEFPLNRVIDGWTEVLQLMNVGDEFEVYIPGELAYKERGYPPEIGPNETLVFKIELLDIVK